MDESGEGHGRRGAHKVSHVYADVLERLYEVLWGPSTIRILVVVDGVLSLTEDAEGFGVARVVRLLRESQVGLVRFEVDTARRDGGEGSPRYSDFRFDKDDGGRPVLDQYDEVWCFGFNPGNTAGPDDEITKPEAVPTTDSELHALTSWMNERRGGVLAMGDHDYLGASMCHRIPRVRSMRRWTNAQGVPPIGGFRKADTYFRHDTNQPDGLAERFGLATIPFANQEDAVPQPIDWVPWITERLDVFRVRVRPHPILCHPTLGPIDVMPDHPHEGWLFEDWEINPHGTYSFGGLSGDEYPTVGGVQPTPRLVAHGTTTPNPPFRLEKGPSPKKRFGMIGVYDGHPARVGRVVTDSTWHHWFDQNLRKLEAASGQHWAKISRYFLNVATWLAPPGRRDPAFVFDILTTHFTYLGFEEYSRNATAFDLGAPLHTHLSRIYGPCWLTEWALDNTRLVDEHLWVYLTDRLVWKQGAPPPPHPCISCPPFELVEIALLGGVVRATFDLADEVHAETRAEASRVDLHPDALLQLQDEGVKIGVSELRRELARSLEELAAVVR